MIFLYAVLGLIVGELAAIVSGSAVGTAIGFKKIDVTLAFLMGMFYASLAGIGLVVAFIFYLIKG